MKCLQKYQWVKLPRSALPTGKGLMGAWMKLASRAAFRKGAALYCGYENAVEPGMWAGGVVGLKSILGGRSRAKALETLEKLSQLGYLTYELDKETKKLTYQITDWVVKCSGKECMDGTVYATDGYGFLCLPRNITERLAEKHYKFEEADAWLDLWCHTVWEDPDNGFSFLAPAVQYGKYGANLTLETLGQRWGWEKTKVWRFLKKHGDAFNLYRLPGNYGCLIYNKLYPTGMEVSLPDQSEVVRIFEEIRFHGANTHKGNVGKLRFGKLVAWFIRKLRFPASAPAQESRVALFGPIIRAYISPLMNSKSCIYDCKGCYCGNPTVIENHRSQGDVMPIDLSKSPKEFFDYGEQERFSIREAGSTDEREVPGVHQYAHQAWDSWESSHHKRKNPRSKAKKRPGQLPQHPLAPAKLPHPGLDDGVLSRDSGRGAGQAVFGCG